MPPETIDELVDEYLQRLRQGDRPDVDEYAARHPDLAEEIRDVFPTLRLMELGKPATEELESSLSQAFDPRLPMILGDFRLLREVGHGGMGIVFEAEQLTLERQVAVKVLPPKVARNPRHLVRFRREARAAARLHHTNIVPVFEIGEQDGVHFYAMQFIRGQGLDQVIRDLGQEDSAGNSADPLARASFYRRVARIGVQVADALAHAHAHGILHRDIKPSNLLLDVQGTVWVTDFGLAKDESTGLTRSGDVLGTLRYLAPECLRQAADARSDLYSLGLTLFELLTRKPAFPGNADTTFWSRAATLKLTRLRSFDPFIPPDLETIVRKAAAHEPSERYPTAQALADDLRLFLEGLPIRARRVTTIQRSWMWCRRNPRLAGLMATAASLFLLACLGGGAAHALRQQRDRAVRAEHAARNAERAAKSAEREARARGLLAAGISLRLSGLPQAKRRSLAALREAVQLEPPPALRQQIRDEAIAALAMTDVNIRHWPWDHFQTDGADLPPPKIISEATSQDLQYVAFADAARGEIAIHDLATGHRIRRLPFRLWRSNPAAAYLRFSPNGQWLAASSYPEGGQLGVVRSDSGDWIYHRDNCWGFAFSGDDHFLAVATEPKGIEMIQLQDPHAKQVIATAQRPVWIAFRADGRQLAACYGDDARHVEIFALPGGTREVVLDAPGTVYVEWHPLGDYLAVARGNKTRAEIWDVPNQRRVARTEGLNSYVSRGSFHEDGDVLMTFSWDSRSRFWSALTLRPLVTLPRSLKQCGSMSDAVGSFIDSSGFDVVYLDRPSSIQTFQEPSPQHPVDGTFSPDGRWLATRRGTDGEASESVELWDVLRRRRRAVLHLDRIGNCGWSPAGDELHLIHRQGLSLFPINARTQTASMLGPPIEQLHPAQRSGCDVTSDGGTWCEIEGRILRVHVRNKGLAENFELQVPAGHRHVCLSDDGRVAITYGWHSPRAKIWDLELRLPRHEIPIDDGSIVELLRYTPYAWSRHCAAYRAWDLDSGRCVLAISRDDTTLPGPLDIGPSGQLAVMSLSHDALHLVRLPQGNPICRLQWPGGSQLAFARLSPDESQILAPLPDRSLAIWDLRILETELESLNLNLLELSFNRRESESDPDLAMPNHSSYLPRCGSSGGRCRSAKKSGQAERLNRIKSCIRIGCERRWQGDPIPTPAK